MKFLYLPYQLVLTPQFLLYLFSAEKEKIRQDVLANRNKSRFFWYDLTWMLAYSPYFRSLFYFRIKSPIKHLFKWYNPRRKLFTIDRFTKIAGGVKLAHPYATIINAASIGKNLYINHLVTIGEKDGKNPHIGDNVQIHAHAMIIGGISIGDNAIIGAGSVVVKDVPKNAVVAGNPAKIINNINVKSTSN